MRTISKNLKRRLLAQIEEANFQGLEKVASQLEVQSEAYAVRDDSEEYIYSENDLRTDVESLLWSAAVRTQDYFGKTADASKIATIVDSYSDEIIESIRNTIGGDVIGPHEPLIPGEKRFVVEIDEDE
ncbi:MAG: hypothetical protein WC942_01155 [Clostridia bacterium]|jgi:hypothetical protein